MKKINLRGVEWDLGLIRDIVNIDEALIIMQSFKNNKCFSPNQIDREITYLNLAKEALFNKLAGAQEEGN